MSKSNLPIKLSQIQGQVHQFKGIIDRFGSFESKEGYVITVCVKDLRLIKTNQRVDPDHWWFRRRQEWTVLNLQPDDEISFTAKIQRTNKGYQNNSSIQAVRENSPLRVDFGPSLTVRDLCVLKHKKYIEPVESEKDKLIILLSEEVKQKDKYAELFSNLNSEIELLYRKIDLSQKELHSQSLKITQKYQQKLKEKEFQIETLIKEKEFQIETLSKDKKTLTCTVSQLENKLNYSIPRKHSFTWLSVSAVIGLVMGIGLGGTATRSFAR